MLKGGLPTDSVRYTVRIDDSVRADKLKDTSFTLMDIYPTLTYSGEVIATNNKGVTTKISFTIDAEKTFIYSNRSANFFSCYALNGLLAWDKPGFAPVINIVSNDTLFAQIQQVNSEKRTICALNIKTGKTNWEIADPMSYYHNAQELLYDNGIVYEVGLEDIFAFDARTGGQLWSKPNNILNFPSAGAGILFCIDSDVANNQFLIAYDGRTGAEKWRYKTRDQTFGLPAVYDGVVYLALSTSTESFGTHPKVTLYAFDQQTGLQIWNCTFLGSVGTAGEQSRPFLIGDDLYISVINAEPEDNNLFAVNRSSKRVIWQQHYISSGYLFGNADGLYIDAQQAGIIKVNPLTGLVIWNFWTNYYNLPGQWVFTPDLLVTHDPNSNSIFPSPFKVYSTATGKQDITTLSSVKMIGPIIIIDNGKAYYPPENGVLK